MADNNYTGSNGGSWTNGANWSLGHKPTGAETALIDNTTPAGPGTSETIGGLTCLGVGGSFSNVDVHGPILLDSCGVDIHDQTDSGSTVTLQNIIGSSGESFTANNIAGPIDASAATGLYDTITIAACNGNVTLGAQMLDRLYATINARLTAPADATRSPSHIVFGAPSTLTYTGSDTGWVSSSDGSGPHTVNSTADLIITPPASGNGLALDGATVNCGGNCIVTINLLNGNPPSINGATFNGPSLASKFFLAVGATGTPIVNNFAPLYQVGAGSAASAYGETQPIIIPATTDVKLGVLYGKPSSKLTGSSAGGGGGGKTGTGLGL